MNLNFSEEELQFQREVRQFLAQNLPAHIIEGTANNGSVFVEKDIALEWQAILVKKGWAVPQWPVEHGGTDWTPAQKYIFSKECYHAGAPMLIPLGLLMLEEQTLLEWDAFRQKAVTLRAAGPWEELKHKETDIVFYFDVDEEVYSFQKPDLVVTEDINKRGADIIAADRPEDWRRMRLEADTLRRAADWEEQRDRVTECVFYYNSVTGEVSFFPGCFCCCCWFVWV